MSKHCCPSCGRDTTNKYVCRRCLGTEQRLENNRRMNDLEGDYRRFLNRNDLDEHSAEASDFNYHGDFDPNEG